MTATTAPSPPDTTRNSRVAVAIEDQSYRLPYKKLLAVISSLCLCIFVSYLDQTRALLISTVILFSFGNLLSGFAKTAVWLFVARAIVGIGGGGINSLVNIISMSISPHPESLIQLFQVSDVHNAFSFMSFLSTSAKGPLIGGALSTAGWRWVFWFTVPITTACLVQLWWMLPQNKMSGGFREKLRKVDFIGSIISLAAGVLVLVPLSGGGIYYSWNSALVISMLTVGSILAVLFILVEWRIAELPILPLYLFRIRNIFIVSTTTFLTGIVFFCNLYFLPSYYTDARGFTPVQAGIYLLPLVFIQVVSTIFSGHLMSHTRYHKPYVVVGFAIWTIGTGLQSTFGLDTNKGKMVGYLILQGVGIGFTFQTIFRALGGAIGLVVCTATKNAVLKKELLEKSGLSSQVVASIIRLGPEVVTDSSFDSVVRAAYMSSLRAVFILFVPIAGLSVIMSLFMKSVYLEGDKDVLPVAKTPTPPASRDNLELSDIGEGQPAGTSTTNMSRPPEKSGA
ncbi:hypothetical protein FRC09_021007 [Ceratobasidium sp. 395]|nr:hypothetical protein FRC09_021007 [Ceratobasidium sp. 395]